MITKRLRITLALLALLALATAAVSAGQSGGKTGPPQNKKPPMPEPKNPAALPKIGPTAQGAGPTRLEQLHNQAIAAKRPGGNSASETASLMDQLTKKYSSDVEAQNARVKARFGSQLGSLTSPSAGGGLPATLHNPTATAPPRDLAPPKPGGPPATSQGPGTGSSQPAPAGPVDPCPNSVELKAWQGSPPLDPGEFIVLDGCGFGNVTGEARLVGDFPGGYVRLTLSSWGVTRITATVPMVSGVGDMPSARLQVIHSSGRFSNMLDVGGFRATREVRKLNPSDVALTCGSPNAPQECAFAQSRPVDFFAGATFAGRHQLSTSYDNDCSAVEKLNSIERGGPDKAAVNLRNGWVLAAYAWGWNHDGSGYAQTPEGFAVDSNSATIGLRWGVGVRPCFANETQASVWYRVDLYAVGPKGVPYK